MKTPENLYYTNEHEWVQINDDIATVGVTDFAQSSLGDVVYVEVETLDEELDADEVFGTIEAVKTVSDLFQPVTGIIFEVNETLEDDPELINNDPYGDGWIVKIKMSDTSELNNLMSPEEYKNLTE
jgi:glycine cleavage system H protein